MFSYTICSLYVSEVLTLSKAFWFSWNKKGVEKLGASVTCLLSLGYMGWGANLRLENKHKEPQKGGELIVRLLEGEGSGRHCVGISSGVLPHTQVCI